MENTIESTSVNPNTGEVEYHYHVTDDELAEDIQEELEEAAEAAVAQSIEEIGEDIHEIAEEIIEEAIERVDTINDIVRELEETSYIGEVADLNPRLGMNPPPFYAGAGPIIADTAQEFTIEAEREAELVEVGVWEAGNLNRDSVRKREAFVEQVKEDRKTIPPVLGVKELMIRQNRKERKVTTTKDITITGHDMMIMKDENGFQIDHCMRLEPKTYGQILHIGRNGIPINGMHDVFYFDKNFNHIIMDRTDAKKDVHKTLRGVYPRFKGQMVKDITNAGGRYRRTKVERFIVINKKKFIDSKGDIFAIKRKEGFSYEEILEIRNDMRRKLRHAERFVKRMKKIVGTIYDEENFDIFYGLVFEKVNPNNFFVYIRFPDVTITNSIEIEHYLGDIFTRVQGFHDSRWKFRIASDLYGMRGTFTPLDRVLKWSHSHLAKSNDSHGFSSFCIGGDNHMFSGNDYELTISNYEKWETTVLEFESILISIEDFISWESLEGGPYNRMEDIKLYGDKIRQLSSIDDLGCNDPYLRESLFKKILTDENLEKLKSCFRLIKVDNRAKYIVDFRLFYTIILSIFEKDEIDILSAKYKQRTSIYNPLRNEFYQSTVRELGSWEGVKTEARKMLPAKRILYMNGKYHKPALIKMNETPTDLKGNLASVDPIFLTRIANVFLHQLTTKLIENGKEKR